MPIKIENNHNAVLNPATLEEVGKINIGSVSWDVSLRKNDYSTSISLKDEGVLSPHDLSFQEERRKRKVRKLDFEIR